MIPEYLASQTVTGSSKLESIFRQEGRDFAADRRSYQIELQEAKESRAIDRFVRRVFTVAEKVDDAAQNITEASLKVLTMIRKTGVHVGLLPWEVWFEERGGDLRETDQKTIVRDWLSDALFKKGILKEYERVSPEFTAYWGNRFDTIAGDMIDAPVRTGLTSLLLSSMEGAATVSGPTTAAFIVARIPVGQLDKALSAMTFDIVNRMRGVSGYLASDIRRTLSPYDPDLVADVLVNQILVADANEYLYRSARVSAFSTWLGLSLGIGTAGFVKDGNASLLWSGLYSGIIGIPSLFLGRRLRVSLLDEYSQRFGEVAKKIDDAVQNKERLARVEYEVGLTEGDDTLQNNRQQIAMHKNYVASAVGDLFPSSLSAATFLAGIGDSAAGPALALSRAVQQFLFINDSYVQFRSSLAQRETAFDRLRGILESIKGARGPLTDTLLEPYKGLEVDWNQPEFSLQMQSIGLPHIDRRKKAPIDTVAILDAGHPLTLNAGEIALLIGENGDGKSTLINTLSGVHVGRLEDTQIRWNGTDLRSMSAAERKRRFFCLTDEMNGDLRTLVGTVMLKYTHTLTHKSYSPDRIRTWVTGQVEDEELEEDILTYFSDNNLLEGINREWFKKGYKPSGYERSVLNYAVHLSIDEPVVVIIDEFENSLSLRNLRGLVSFVDERMKMFKGVMIVASNKQQADWLRLERTVGFIDMREGLLVSRNSEQGHMHDFVSEHILIDLNEKYARRELMSIAEFFEWISHPDGPRKNVLEALKTLREQKGYQSLKYYFDEVIDCWEQGDYGKYLQRNVEKWLDDELTEEAFLTMMNSLNLFYNSHIEIGIRDVRRDTHDMSACREWPYSLHKKLLEVIRQRNTEYAAKLEGKVLTPEGVINLYRHYRTVAFIMDIFTDTYQDYASHIRPPSLLPSEYIKQSHERNDSIDKLFSDPLFVFFAANTRYWDIRTKEYLPYLDRCETLSELMHCVQLLKSIYSVHERFGTRVSLWDSINLKGEIDAFVQDKKERLASFVV